MPDHPGAPARRSPAQVDAVSTDARPEPSDLARSRILAPPLEVRRQRPPVRHAFALVDLCACLAAGAAAFVVALGKHPSLSEAGALVLVALFQLVSLAGYGVYSDPRARASAPTLVEFGRILGALTTAFWVYFVLTEALSDSVLSVESLAVAWLLSIALVLAGRFAMRRVWLAARAPDRALVLGAGKVGQALALQLLDQRGSAVQIAGFLDPEPRDPIDPRLERLPVFRGLDELESALEATRATRVVIAFSRLDAAAVLEIVRECDRRGVDVDVVPRLYELFANRPRLDAVGGIPLLGLPPVERSAFELAAKRALDVAVAAVSLVLLAPLLLFIAALIRLDSPGPALYRHSRVGRHGGTFRMVKFRTMELGADEREEWLKSREQPGSWPVKHREDKRITRVGRFLRKTSVDELPQLWNVLRGDMSLVGPRPLPIYEHAVGDRVDGMRLEVRPGLTGLWQVLGRSDVEFDERMRLDYLYARNQSLAWDLHLIARTVAAIVRGKGAY